MKKFYFFIFAIMFSSLVFVSCVDNTYNLAKENISEIRQTVLAYKDKEVYVTFMSGYRESEYALDGISMQCIDFAVINLEFLNVDYEFNEKSVKYKVTINDVNYNGDMLNNPYDNSFVIDLKVNATKVSALEIEFEYDGEQKTCNLVSISNDWKVDSNKALEICSKDLKDYLKQHITNNNLEAEVFIKVVYNDKYTNDYYWYIQFITKNGNEYTEIINPRSGEILAKNIK